MKKISAIILAISLAGSVLFSFASCSANKEKSTEVSSSAADSIDSKAMLQGMLDGFKANKEYVDYKAMFPNTTFEEKIDGDSILINISGTEGIEGNYEYKLDGDYLTFTDKTDSDDYTGISFFMFLTEAAEKQLGMEPSLVTGYINGAEAFDIENKYFITETDEAAGTTTVKQYIAEKYDMPELETMYANEKSLEYTDAYTDDHISGSVNVGKITMIYSGSKNDSTIIFREYGKRDDLTYKSIMSTVAKLQPNGYETFAKEYTELKEVEGNGYKVSFSLDDELKSEYELPDEGYEYTVVHFGA